MLTRNEASQRYRQVRRQTTDLCVPLEVEDHTVQPAAHVSPPKWHLAHTTWFFETFALATRPNHQPFHEQYNLLFNSYYEACGPRVAQDARGTHSRPTVADVMAYRRWCDDNVLALFEETNERDWRQLADTIELGLHHEQQHQELLAMDILAILGRGILFPAFRPLYRPGGEPPVLPIIERSADAASDGVGKAKQWQSFEAGDTFLGQPSEANGDGFVFDNETPRHRRALQPYELATELSTNRDYIAFIEDGGYQRADLWLSDGWSWRQQHDITLPLYWTHDAERYRHFTLSGRSKVPLDAPVCHVSLYEAAAFAEWSKCRLPTEVEWEHAALNQGANERRGGLLEDGLLEPLGNLVRSRDSSGKTQNLIGEVWEWTASSYSPYPGYIRPKGAFGEYNGKFMANQMVLRGGCCVTPRSHIRTTYRNFYQPDKRWQFSGIRLARNVS